MTETFDPKKILFADLDENEAVVLNLESKSYYKLNETGRWIWLRLADGRSPQEAAQELSRAFEVPIDDALGDVAAFVETLRFEAILSSPAKAHSIEAAHRAKMGKQPL